MSSVRNYAIVTSSYFLFTITDGAIRMLVLLHFYSLGYTPFMLAFLFLLYETAGIFANVGGGWLASRMVADQWSPDTLTALYRAAGTGTPLDTLLRTNLHLSLADFTARWRQYVQQELG